MIGYKVVTRGYKGPVYPTRDISYKPGMIVRVDLKGDLLTESKSDADCAPGINIFRDLQAANWFGARQAPCRLVVVQYNPRDVLANAREKTRVTRVKVLRDYGNWSTALGEFIDNQSKLKKNKKKKSKKKV